MPAVRCRRCLTNGNGEDGNPLGSGPRDTRFGSGVPDERDVGQLAGHLVWDQVIAGSSPVVPTILVP
jgi:hypothetical protein